MAPITLSSWQTVGLALFGGILPAMVWLWFWLREDSKNPEPKGVIWRIFFCGALAVIPAFLLEKYTLNYLDPIKNIYYEPAWSFSMVQFIVQSIPLLATWALIEESVKLIAAYIGGLKSKAYDEPLDAMIYFITAAAGFAACENVLFLIKTLYDPNWHFTFLLTGNLRFLGATVLHIVSSAFCGAIIAMAACSGKKTKFLAIVGGLLTATVLHALFNFFIILNEGRDIFKVLLVLWLISVLLIALFESIKHRICKVVIKN